MRTHGAALTQQCSLHYGQVADGLYANEDVQRSQLPQSSYGPTAARTPADPIAMATSNPIVFHYPSVFHNSKLVPVSYPISALKVKASFKTAQQTLYTVP